MLCCPAFSLPFNGLLVLVLFQFPDEVPDNLDFLPPVAAGLVRRVDDNTMNEFTKVDMKSEEKYRLRVYAYR